MATGAAVGGWNRHGRRRTFAAVAVSVVALAVVVPACSGEGTARHDYVALGDSYASGEGNSPYDEGTDVRAGAARDQCHRSAAAYARVLAAARHLDLVVAACSGATLANLLEPQYAPEHPQLDALSRETKLVTVTVGANDLHAVATLVGCVVGGVDCSFADKSIAAGVAAFEQQLGSTLAEIRRRAPSAGVLVVGYPQILPVELPAVCPGLGPVLGPERAAAVQWFRAATTALNTAMRRAAEANATRYVDTEDAFAGHDVCAADTWVFGLTLSPASRSFHPTARGQQALAGVVERSVDQP